LKKAQLITPEANFGTDKGTSPRISSLDNQAKILKEFINSIAHKRLKSVHQSMLPAHNLIQNNDNNVSASTGIDINKSELKD
jgi:hypothetical protein